MNRLLMSMQVQFRFAVMTLLLGAGVSACDKSAEPATATPDEATPPADAGASDAQAVEPPETVAEDDGAAADEAGDTEAETPGDTAGPDSATSESSGAWAASSGPAPVPEDPAEGLTEPTSFANVKVEIKTPGGEVLRDKGKTIPWARETKIPFEFDGGNHELVVEVAHEGKKANVELSYDLDGVEVLRSYRFDTRVGKREVIRIEGGSALAITVTPKTVRPRPEAKRDEIDQRKGKDPLAGADKGK